MRLIPVWLIALLALVVPGPGWSADKKVEKSTTEKIKPEEKPGLQKSAPDAGVPEKAGTTESPAPDDELPGIGDKAPGFLLKDSNGVYHRLSDSAGNTLLLVFFRTDCEPCLVVMQQVVAFYLGYRDEVDVLAVALLERSEGRARLDEYLESARLPFPVLVDVDDRVASAYIMKNGEATLPALFFVDEDGLITQRLYRLSMPLESYLED